MGPPKPAPEASETGTPIDRTPEYEAFIAKLKEFHEKRGTNFDALPRMGVNQVDLYKLFNHIMEHGGYDKVSDEKLAWRRMCEGLGLMTSNPPAAAFGLKTIFYKYLAAYEIKTVHKKEPPPPEILEHITARGSGLLTRTLDTFKSARRESGHERSDGDESTPARDRRPEDTPNSSRASRGLREAPPQRVIFQPDTTSPRQTRQASGQHPPPPAATPQTATNPQAPSRSNTPIQPPNMHTVPHHHQRPGPSHGFNPPAPELRVNGVFNYQPSEPTVTPTRVVPTPINATESYNQERRVQGSRRGLYDPAQIRRPGTGSEGPNIYSRCVTSLRSGIPSEQAFGLHHLVKISFERGEKFRFEQFPGLLDGLTEKALEVGNLFYDVEWSISYMAYMGGEQEEGPIGELDGVDGTPDIIDRISRLRPKNVQDSIIPAEFSDQLVLITESVLTIRNMAMLYDNAAYLAEYPPLKDLLCIILHLPKRELAVELKHFALEIAEQVTPNLVLESDDPLYQTLLSQLDMNSNDRGCILSSLRALGRISMNLAETNKLGGVPASVLQSIMNWLLLNDDELMDACLDLLYQYTAVIPNLDALLKAVRVEDLVTHLVRLLSHGAKREVKEIIIEPERKLAGGETIVGMPSDLFDRLLATEEPERSYQWLRSLFEEDVDSQITQIAVWQAYTGAFAEPLKRANRNMINAADFIRNINQVYQNARAQIVRDHGPTGEVNRFIIKGIRPRPRPLNPDGREYLRCVWSRRDPEQPEPQASNGNGGNHHDDSKCGAWFVNASATYDHIIQYHLGVTRNDTDNLFKNRDGEFTCHWGGCQRYQKPTKMQLAIFMAHVKTHLLIEERNSRAFSSSTAAADATPGSKRARRPYLLPARTISLVFEETATVRDERNPNAPPQAAGIPLSAILVLRNMARNMAKTEAEEALVKARDQNEPGALRSADDAGWNERLFRPVMPRLYEVMAENKYLAPHIASLLQLLEF